VYRPATFIDTMVDNLTTTLLLGLLLLVLVVVALLFDWRATLVTVLTIATAAASTVMVLGWFGIALNMMTMAGLVMALAIVVDDAIVGVAAIQRRRRDNGAQDGADSRTAAVLAVAVEMRSPLLVATAITAVAVAPVLFLDGVAGSFLGPLVQAFLLAVGVSMVVALTVGPAYLDGAEQ
jgi:multidrug efflux pump subunit AcrB